MIFSEWRRMLDRIEPLLTRAGLGFVRLDGQVPQKQRPGLVRTFQEEPGCRVILMTNAGSTGLNLQSANVVINVDLPWNPAVLEQRIARAHRMGQRNPVHVYVLVSEGTIEERLLTTLASKQDLADAALDMESDVEQVSMTSGIEDLKRRLERLLGDRPAAAIDESQRRQVEQESTHIQQRRERVAAAGGELLGAAIQLLGELVEAPSPNDSAVAAVRQGLDQCVERDDAGRPQLRIALPDESSLQTLAQALAKLLVAGKS